MEIPTSDKTSNFVERPHIRKGYYPGKLLKVEEFKKEGELVEKTFGYQLICEFAIYEPDKDGKPIKEMTVKDKDSNVELPVTLSKFVYFMNKKKESSVTKKSAFTKTFEAMGWEFTPDKPCRVDDFIGKWIELNVDDYEKEVDGSKAVMSVIKDVGKYSGPAMEKSLNESTEEKKEVKKNLSTDEKTARILEIEENLDRMKKLKKDNLLSQSGYDQAVEQLNKELEEMKK